MKFTIIRDMGLVHVDGRGHDELDMSTVPTNIHAVQWYGDHGSIEYTDNTPNDSITQVPEWAFNIAASRKVVIDAEIAAEAQAEADRQAYLNSPQFTKDTNIREAEEYLAKTDWIVTKITEKMLTGEDVTGLKSKYAKQLSNREMMRETININQA